MKNYPKLEPDDYYTNEQGYVVMTAKYHLKRGYCCGNGCKHCPYPGNEVMKKASEEESDKVMKKESNEEK